MPSTSKKQHNFMAAIANNPSFAKKAGVPQSVGKDFSAADKGRKFEKGGATMMGKKTPNAMSAMMVRRPRMGAGMPPPAPPVMPPQPPAPMGMKKGGKVRRFEEGGDTVAARKYSPEAEKWLGSVEGAGGADRTDAAIVRRMKSANPNWDSAPATRVAGASAGSWEGHDTPAPAAQSVPKVEGRDTYGNDFPDGDVGGGRTTDFKATPAAKPKTPQTAPSTPKEDDTPQKQAKSDELAKLAPRLREAGFSSGVKDYIGPKQAKSDELAKLAPRLREAGFSSGFKKYTGPEQKTTENNVSFERNKKLRAEKLAADLKDFEREAMTNPDRQKRNAQLYEAQIAAGGGKPLNKGGAVKKYAKGGMAHGGMHKMPNGKMMKNSAMKEGGMPMKDGKPAFMMGKKKMMGGMAGMKEGGMPMKDGKPAFLMGKKMNMGGMAKYAKGGGIESRGKTKGTIIRMAAGGSVGSASRRADGIAQRGKTRG